MRYFNLKNGETWKDRGYYKNEYKGNYFHRVS